MLSIAQLCVKYGNEDVHTQHVTALALRLFDATRNWLHLSRSDRPLLEAAARLHDIGYSLDPERHPKRSAKLVLQEGLAGFTPAQRRVIAQVIPLHGGNISNSSHQPPRALALAAFLRIADGLDHGHAQDAVITNVKRVRDVIRVTVRSEHFPYNVARADRKADLWRAVFPVDIQFIAARVPKRQRSALIEADLPVLEAARKLMSLQLKTVMINVDGVIAGTDPLALRDVRVAIRRLRLLLRVFRKRLPESTVQSLSGALQHLNRQLSPVRDLGVWMAYWEDPEVQQSLAHHRQWQTFVDYQKQRRRAQLASARRAMRSVALTTTRVQLGQLLRVELPRRIRRERPGNLKKLAARKLDKALRRVWKLGRLRNSTDPYEVHRLRRALRQARYLGGFFGSLLGPDVEKLTRRVHATERALSQIHDADMALMRVREEVSAPLPPRVLLHQLRQRRRESAKRAEATWERLTQAGFLRGVKHTLKQARR
ncbi:MAG TPA: CHAD domain-containing protein [Verrucomicrobiae bacterium]|nr:CHAD domain-containing protein [Verrucomicrobiae bacterium]